MGVGHQHRSNSNPPHCLDDSIHVAGNRRARIDDHCAVAAFERDTGEEVFDLAGVECGVRDAVFSGVALGAFDRALANLDADHLFESGGASQGEETSATVGID